MPRSASRRRHPEAGHFLASAAGAALLFGAGLVPAQTLDAGVERVVVTASGAERRTFDTPYAVGVVDAEQLRAAGPMVNLSEALSRLPGLVVNNRNNYAQDLQINSRGFGARATFGVRGVRLYADGIAATGPDGQGQVSHFDIAGAQRIEVLRGPFSALYGNSSGGVISLVSAAPTERRYAVDGDVGSDGLRQWRIGVEAPFEGGFSLRAQIAGFETDGFRAQSSATRTLGNVRLGWDGERDRVVIVLNSIDQPALDPLGLTRTQFEQDPDQTAGIALPQDAPGQGFRYNTRKDTRQNQAGASWRHRFDDGGALRESLVTAYSGQRSVTQWQSILDSAQLSPTSPGGVIDFDRKYLGVDGRLVWRWALDGERSAQLVAGVSADTSDEARRGYENFVGDGPARVLGVTGRLRRDEDNRADSGSAYAQGEIELSPSWAATLGVRSGRVKFRSDDHYINAANPDDSGSLAYRYTNPVAALQWRASTELNVYLSAGRGFESPTFGELAYRPDGGPGFNSDLKAQTSRQFEIGAKWRSASLGLALDAALFDARTENEIGVATNTGGRSTFANVGRTTRQGAELDLRWRIAEAWRAQIAATWLDATYTDGFCARAVDPCTPALVVPPGNRIAGTLARSGYAELAWLPVASTELALESRFQSDVPVNDVNSDFAAGFGLLALRARWQVDAGPGRLELLGRVDNLADRRVVGSVIVNEGNLRFFEPAAGRTMLLSARWSQRF